MGSAVDDRSAIDWIDAVDAMLDEAQAVVGAAHALDAPLEARMALTVSIGSLQIALRKERAMQKIGARA